MDALPRSPFQIIPASGRAPARAYDTAGWDRLLKTHPVVPALVYVPIAVFFLCRSYKTPGFVGSTWLLYMGGLFLWTLLEYAVHRGLLHFADVGARWNMGLAQEHARHHEHPEDVSQVIISPFQTLPLALIVYWAVRIFLNPGRAGGLVAGLLTGYLAYETFHYAFHAPVALRWKWLNALRKYHARHHFETPDARYGVTTPLWDLVFARA